MDRDVVYSERLLNMAVPRTGVSEPTPGTQEVSDCVRKTFIFDQELHWNARRSHRLMHPPRSSGSRHTERPLLSISSTVSITRRLAGNHCSDLSLCSKSLSYAIGIFKPLPGIN